MSFYISGPVQNDPTIIKQRFTDYVLSYAPPGFVLQKGDPLDLLAEACALEAAAQADVANSLLDDAFRYFGGLVRTPPIDAIPATSQATFTVQDTAGYTVDAGSVIGVRDSTGTLQGFDLLADVVIAAGATTGTGTVQAEEPGTVCNGLSGAAQLVQVPAYVTAATMTAATDGVDAELQSVYMDRLAETFTLFTPIPVLAPNFAVLARSVPGVFRAAGVNLLKPGPPYDTAAEATGVEKNVTVAVADINGQPVGATIRGNVKTYLQAFREQNFVVWVVDPQYTQIDVTAIVFAWPNWDLTDVQTRVTAALQSLLSPATWGTDPTGNAARWLNDPTLRAGIVQQTIYSVPGVRYTDPQPTFDVHGGTPGTADVTLGAGSAIPALPTAGTISVTVNATTP